MSQKYVVFSAPAAEPGTTEIVRYAEGTAFECVIRLLEHCTLTQLNALKLHGIHSAQKRVAKRTAEECAAKVERELNGQAALAYDAADRSGQVVSVAEAYADVPPPESVNVLDDEEDEPGDDVGTPLEVIDPTSGVREGGE